jgi:RNA polymerase sigma-70 factor (ECF subfamily)
MASHLTEPGVAPNDESDLVARAQRGDVDAFQALYRASAGRVFAVCLRMSGDRTQATELLQDVFVRIWERLKSFRGESAFATWAHRLAVNVVLEAQRKEQRQGRLEIGQGTLDSGDEGRESVAWTAAPSVADRIDLENAIARLAPGMRRVFVLHDIEGYQHNEIAKMTGQAEGTLRAQLHHARKQLMEALER